MTTPGSIPIFPLPGVVLLPGTLLPLHIFEPRYRAMVSDALAGDRLIGMAMIRDEDAETARPPVHAIGGAGEIVESQELEDGRYNIVLEGKFRYRILEEDHARPYRVAKIERVASLPFPSLASETRALRDAILLFAEVAAPMELPALPAEALSAERLGSELAVRLRYSPEELQRLLEVDSLPGRFEALSGRMEEWRRRIRFLAPFRASGQDAMKN
ncbi:MAG TPA: LON peptidase substrate-binding domain-containing protein [Thermoanaerobaculia bacterium]